MKLKNIYFKLEFRGLLVLYNFGGGGMTVIFFGSDFFSEYNGGLD